MPAQAPCFQLVNVPARLAMLFKAVTCFKSHGTMLSDSDVRSKQIKKVMGSEAAAMELEQRLKVDAPWVFEDNYGVESALFRRERIIYLYEHGHSLLSAALERDPWTKPVVLFDSACIPPFHL